MKGYVTKLCDMDLNTLYKILDQIELHPRQRQDLKDEAKDLGVLQFLTENEALVIHNEKLFKL